MPAGRPRSEAARAAVLEATLAELAERGFDKLSIDRIAVASGVSKPTIYRWYPSKNALVADCLLEGYLITPTIGIHDHADVRDDVLAWIRDFIAITTTPGTLALIRAAASASAEDPEIARGFQQQMKTASKDALAARIRRGVDAGQLREGTPATAVAEMIVGTFLYRLFNYEDITPQFIDEVVAVIFEGLTVGSESSR
jgi:AcrR family transcriptional regulator